MRGGLGQPPSTMGLIQPRGLTAIWRKNEILDHQRVRIGFVVLIDSNIKDRSLYPDRLMGKGARTGRYLMDRPHASEGQRGVR